MGARVKIVLPPAPPDAYRRWMTFWREVEQKMLDRPALEVFASDQSAPFLRGEAVAFWSDVVVSAIMTQALIAKRAGDRLVSPAFEGDIDLIVEATEMAERRDWWLSLKGMAATIGIEPLEPDLVRLRASVITVIRDQMAKRAGRRQPKRRRSIYQQGVVYDLRCPCCESDLGEIPSFLLPGENDFFCEKCSWGIPISAVRSSVGSVMRLPECPTHPDGVLDFADEKSRGLGR